MLNAFRITAFAALTRMASRMSHETHLPTISLNRSIPRDNARRPDIPDPPYTPAPVFLGRMRRIGMTPDAGPVNRSAIAKRAGEVKNAGGWRNVTRRKF